MLELARSALSNLVEAITFDRFIALLEVVTIGIAAILAFRVGKRQNQINENLLGLHLTPRLTVTCDPKGKKIHISNQGGSTVYVWGFQGLGFSNKIGEEPVAIEPNASIKIKVFDLFTIAKTKKASSVEPIFIFVSTIDGKKFKLKTTIHFDFEDSELQDVRAQNHPIGEWRE